jgi:hypothetical protein
MQMLSGYLGRLFEAADDLTEPQRPDDGRATIDLLAMVLRDVTPPCPAATARMRCCSRPQYVRTGVPAPVRDDAGRLAVWAPPRRIRSRDLAQTSTTGSPPSPRPLHRLHPQAIEAIPPHGQGAGRLLQQQRRRRAH